MAKYFIMVPIETDIENAVVFLNRVRSALTSENVIGDDEIKTVILTEGGWRLEDEIREVLA